MIKLNGQALLIAALLCSAIGLASCSSTPTTNTGNVTVTNANKPANTAPANTAKTETVATGDKTGVPECDEYIEKYEVCLTSIGEKYPQIQPSLKTAFESQRKGFKDAAASPSGKTTLPGICKQAMESQKEATKTYACKW